MNPKVSPRKINIIGPFPPPYGGISVHLKRISDYLNRPEVLFFDSSPSKKKEIPTLKKTTLLSFFFKYNQLFHYHSTSINIRLALSLCGTINPFIFLHAHGASLTDQLRSSSWKSRLLKVLLPNVNIICSNTEIYDFLKSNFTPKSLHIYDAFLPPVYDSSVHSEVLKIIEVPNSKYLISMTGWFAIYNNEDLYGFDIMLEALNKLRNKGIDTSIIASVNGINNQELFNNFIKRRNQLGLEDHFYLITEDLPELYPIIIESDLFVRPTNTDGNAVSIKEAIWFETPVIASNIVPRPNEVLTFQNRDIDDLVKTIIEILPITNTEYKLEKYSEKKFEHPMISEIYGFN